MKRYSYNKGKNNPSFNKRKYSLSYNFLYNEYISNFKSAVTIAKEQGVAYSTIQLYLSRLGIKRRSKSESQELFLKFNKHQGIGFKHTAKYKNFMSKIKKGICGKNHPCFGRTHTIESKKKISLSHGGTGIPYEHNHYDAGFFRKKSIIRERDNYTCQECYKIFNQRSKELDVHHIDYNKKNSNDNNLICLCHLCNVRANFNRDYWKHRYQDKMKEIIKYVASTLSPVRK